MNPRIGMDALEKRQNSCILRELDQHLAQSLIPYIEQFAFRLYKVNYVLFFGTSVTVKSVKR